MRPSSAHKETLNPRADVQARELHEAGVRRLVVRVRDGTGLIGPLFVPCRT